MRKLLQTLYVPLLLVLVGALAYVPASLLGGQVDRLEGRVTDIGARTSQVDKDLAVLAVNVPLQLSRMEEKLTDLQRNLDLLVSETTHGDPSDLPGRTRNLADNGGEYCGEHGPQ